MTHRLVETATNTRFLPATLLPATLLPAALLPAALLPAALLCTSLASAEESERGGSGSPQPPAESSSTGSSKQARRTTPAAPDDDAWLAWTAVGVGSGLLALSTWQWIVFANENSDAGSLCRARNDGLARCTDADERDRYVNARDDAKRARTLGVISGGLGAASLVAGILLFPDSDADSGQANVAFSIDPVAGDARASLSWTW